MMAAVGFICKCGSVTTLKDSKYLLNGRKICTYYFTAFVSVKRFASSGNPPVFTSASPKHSNEQIDQSGTENSKLDRVESDQMLDHRIHSV